VAGNRLAPGSTARTLSSATRSRCRSSSWRFSIARRVRTARAVASALGSAGTTHGVVGAGAAAAPCCSGERRRAPLPPLLPPDASFEASAAAAAASLAALDRAETALGAARSTLVGGDRDASLDRGDSAELRRR